MLIVETTEARQHLSLHGLNSVWTNKAKHAFCECVPAAHDLWSSYKSPHRLTCTLDVSQNEIPLTQLVSSLNSTQKWDHFHVSTWMLFFYWSCDQNLSQVCFMRPVMGCQRVRNEEGDHSIVCVVDRFPSAVLFFTTPLILCDVIKSYPFSSMKCSGKNDRIAMEVR